MLIGMPDSIFLNKNIILCVCGSIAAYKSAELASRLKQAGASVDVVMTESSKQFITPLTMELISGNAVIDGFFNQTADKIPHINLVKKADMILVAPATADYVARSANGYASDIPSVLALAAKCPVVIAPAMNTQMLQSDSYIDNVAKLKAAGKYFIEPGEGLLACGDAGKGRLASIDTIIDHCAKILRVRNSLNDVKFLVTYGPTIEKIDDMRYISNYSSGRTGYYLTQELAIRGADVIVVAGPNKCERPFVSKFVEVESADEMMSQVRKYFDSVDCLIMAAAVADFTVEVVKGKIKRSISTNLRLIPTEDILKSVSALKRDQIIVGFCAESEGLVESAKKKLSDKNLDVVVANMIGQKDIGPGASDNEVYLVSGTDKPILVKKAPKRAIAEQIVDYLTGKYFK